MAGAEVVQFTNQADWETAPADLDLYSSSPTIVSYSFPSSGSKTDTMSGGSSWNAWTLHASSGNLSVGGGMVSAQVGASLVLDFTGIGGGLELRGIGGVFGMRDASGNFAPARLLITLASGQTINKSASTEFAGFWVTDPDARIAGLTISPVSTIFPVDYSAAIESLVFGGVPVPAPGAAALLAVAAIVGHRRR